MQLIQASEAAKERARDRHAELTAAVRNGLERPGLLHKQHFFDGLLAAFTPVRARGPKALNPIDASCSLLKSKSRSRTSETILLFSQKGMLRSHAINNLSKRIDLCQSCPDFGRTARMPRFAFCRYLQARYGGFNRLRRITGHLQEQCPPFRQGAPTGHQRRYFDRRKTPSKGGTINLC
jgi:hypothetical protein